MISNQKKINHVLWRAGFGPSLAQEKKFSSTGQVLEKLFADSATVKELSQIPPDAQLPRDMQGASRTEVKTMLKESRKQAKEVGVSWLQLMFADENVLVEKMALFWHGALACRPAIGYYAQDYTNILRKNALGKFGTLLRAVSKSPAMMMYLDTIKNHKGSPNENFSRELMELFTLGKGNYTEKDIKEAARAFTGWNVVPPAEFTVRQNQHDANEKIIFGKRGDFGGDDVLDMLLENKQTAKHVTEKAYRFFVNENLNDAIVNDLAEKFYKSDYDISLLMKEIFYSDWFYTEENTGTRIKSPVELLAGITRQLTIQYENKGALRPPQQIMGQELLSPPNVSGWPGGKDWIDSSSLMYRLNLGNLFLSQSDYNIEPKIEPEEMVPKDPKFRAKGLKPVADWNSYFSFLNKGSNEEILHAAKEFLIQPPALSVSEEDLISFTSKDSKEDFIRTLTLRLLSTPEYQMC